MDLCLTELFSGFGLIKFLVIAALAVYIVSKVISLFRGNSGRGRSHYTDYGSHYYPCDAFYNHTRDEEDDRDGHCCNCGCEACDGDDDCDCDDCDDDCDCDCDCDCDSGDDGDF